MNLRNDIVKKQPTRKQQKSPKLTAEKNIQEHEDIGDVLKRIPYARLEVGVGVHHHIKVGDAVDCSAGVVVGNEIEVEKGNVNTSKPRIIVHLNASAKAPGINGSSIYYYGGVDIDENICKNPNIFSQSAAATEAVKTDIIGIPKHPKLVKSFHMNTHGLVVVGEVGLNIDELNKAKEMLKENGQKLSLSVRREIKKVLEGK